ncbi:Retrovirus-related Pol polyprotein from transposon RE1 [Cardamine amara subsp. amara]|uniref:Retrovirus-related Pol polyprotein from transposon RE1 n=1 Tax=Cardamine amara subsp. amara TaxID=228776 RepID=A0ABD0ZJU0_CARAN
MNAAMLSDSSTWLIDSGTSYHMTTDLGNLVAHNPYGGGDDVLLGDGSALPITHSGSFSLPSYTKPFFLKNVLCVPSLDKNLISIFQLCTTNGVVVTFTPTYFQVKDLQTGALRLEGKPKDGTYEWPRQ